MICRAFTESLNPGATSSKCWINRSAYASSSGQWSSSSSAQSAGTHWLNIDTVWMPSGASVLSTTVGISVSLNGTRAAWPNRASW